MVAAIETQNVKHVNIKKGDFFRLPDHCRMIFQGKPFVLSSMGGKDTFLPAVIV